MSTISAGEITGSQMMISMSEDARMVQLEKLEKLNNNNDAQTRRHQKQHINPSLNGGYDQEISHSITLSSMPLSQSLRSPPVAGTGTQPERSSAPHGHSTLYSSISNQGSCVGGNRQFQRALHTMDLYHEQQQTSSSTNENPLGSVFSKSSEQSSNTSADTPDRPIKIEEEPNSTFNDPNGNEGATHGSLPTPLDIESVTCQTAEMKSQSSSVKRRRVYKEIKLKVSEFRPRTAIPTGISQGELARQSVEAALSSRLNPFVLHPDEYQLLRDHICHIHVTAYLNIRNRILRLWVRNPLVTVTPEEAAGCAYGSRWLGLAEVAYEWLVRRGYINFGCLEIPDYLNSKQKKARKAGSTIVVIGAGMSGLGCARQLEGLFSHYRDRWATVGEEPPNVVVLEGRQRLGGRIYSQPLKNQGAKRIPRNLRCTAEMGAHIITGFDRGNPLNMIIRGQLALHYYPLKDNSSLHDVDGKIVNRERDNLVEKLFNDILDRASLFRHKQSTRVTVEGERKMIEAGRDPMGDTGKSISTVEAEKEKVINKPENLNDKGLDHVPAGVDKLTGKAHVVPGPRQKAPAAIAAEAMGWKLASPDFATKDLDLDTYANSCSNPTLGGAMDEGVRQYQALLKLSPQDLRLLNWHFANLEYANAANVGKLSLGGWDQDIGNEFEGEHAQVIGGYIQVPRGIYRAPKPLDLLTRHEVIGIEYESNPNEKAKTRVTCANGNVIDASHVVLTVPLGVLKHRSIAFQPPLPHWKLDSIERLGFGTLNKVILVYDKPFWDIEQDMIGLLRDTDEPNSFEQSDYSTNRGRFYLFWNCIKTSGRPLLIALMAGDAAHQAETSLNDVQIIAEVTQQLVKMFRHKPIPPPMETIVTRWGKDKFAMGTYSYVGPDSHSDDYDSMAKPVGNLHFAGEATCGTHPATVHGAYISGLRAASDIIENMLGPIEIPRPLVPDIVKAESKTFKTSTNLNRGQAVDLTQEESYETGESPDDKQARLQSLENDILKTIFDKIGMRPLKPEKAGANPFLLYSKDKWGECKGICDEARRGATGNPNSKASRNEIRTALGQMWRDASDAVKRPYIERTVYNRVSNAENVKGFQDQLATWDDEAVSIRARYIEDHPGCMSAQEEKDMWQALGVMSGAERKAKKESGYADQLP